MFKACLKYDIVLFIILYTDKMFYYGKLKECEKEKGYLIDACLNAQYQYKILVEKYIKDLL